MRKISLTFAQDTFLSCLFKLAYVYWPALSTFVPDLSTSKNIHKTAMGRDQLLSTSTYPHPLLLILFFYYYERREIHKYKNEVRNDISKWMC